MPTSEDAQREAQTKAAADARKAQTAKIEAMIKGQREDK